MTWKDVLGHDENVTRFRRSIAMDRLASTFLFVGPEGVGKQTFATKLAQALLCDVHDESIFDPCGQCAGCQQVIARTHPDFIYISRPADKSTIPVELFIGDREHRMSEGLCHDIALKPYGGRRKIAVIDDADRLSHEGANCLLKTLEEPPPRSLLILIGTSEQTQLPTIRSRAQVVRFGPLSQAHVEQLLLKHELAESTESAAQLATLAKGSLQRAILYTNPDLLGFRQQWLGELSDLRKTPASYAKQLGDFVDQAGKDAPSRRMRMKHLFDLSAEFYRELMVSLCATESHSESVLQEAVQRASQRWQAGREGAIRCLERCVEATSQVDANANQATLLECWIDDLQQVAYTSTNA